MASDPDLHCVQRQGISGFSRVKVKKKTCLQTSAILEIMYAGPDQTTPLAYVLHKYLTILIYKVKGVFITWLYVTVMFPSFLTDMSGKTVQTQIRMLLELFAITSAFFFL